MAGHVVYPTGHPLMKNAACVHGHALTVLARVAASIESLRRHELPGHGPLFRRQRLTLQGAVRGLESRYRELADLYAAFAPRRGSPVATDWRRFFDRYDDFLQALRRARSEVAEAQAPGQGDRGPAGAAACAIPAGARHDVL